MPQKFLSFIVIIILLWFAGFLWFLSLIPAQPNTSTPKADAIIVLTGGALRLEHGFELLGENAAPVLFISGVEDGVTFNSLLRTKEYREFAGITTKENVILGYKARSTQGNAREIAEFVQKAHIKTLLLVTGNYHLPRSIYQIQQLLPEVVIIPEPVFPGHFASPLWWNYRDSLKLVFSEYHKYLYVLSGLKQ